MAVTGGTGSPRKSDEVAGMRWPSIHGQEQVWTLRLWRSQFATVFVTMMAKIWQSGHGSQVVMKYCSVSGQIGEDYFDHTTCAIHLPC